MRKLLREPLLHFLLLGAGLFLLHGMIGGPAAGEGERIVITTGRIHQLAAGFERMQQREPLPAELNALVEDAIREEIYYREAKALRLDEDDTIVRRRLRQKLEFVSEDLTPVPEPTDAQLRAYVQANPDRFRREASYSLTQVYLDPQRHGSHLDGDLRRALAVLRKGASETAAAALADPLLVQRSFDGVQASEVSRLFGNDFETALRTLPLGQWQGPVVSGYGVHLVRLDRREDRRAASLDDVRGDARREWLYAQRQQANSRFYSDLRQRYSVTVQGAGESGRGTAALADAVRP